MARIIYRDRLRRRCPWTEHPTQASVSQCGRRGGARDIGDTQTLYGRVHHQVLIIEDRRSKRIDRQFLPGARELPSIQLAAGHAVANAAMVAQLFRGTRLTMAT